MNTRNMSGLEIIEKMKEKKLYGRKILIIHFEGLFIRRMKKNLEKLGAEIRVVHDAKTAEKLLKFHFFDVVIGCKIIPQDSVAYRIFGMNKRKSPVNNYQGFCITETRLLNLYKTYVFPFATFLFPPQIETSPSTWIKITERNESKIIEGFGDFFNPEAGLTQKIVKVLARKENAR